MSDLTPTTKLLPERCENSRHTHRTIGKYSVCDTIASYWTTDEACGDYPAPCSCDDPTTHGGH